LANKAQIAQMKADEDYWRVLEGPLGWRLHGFTFQLRANFFTTKLESPFVETITLTNNQRDAIVRALTLNQYSFPRGEQKPCPFCVKRLGRPSPTCEDCMGSGFIQSPLPMSKDATWTHNMGYPKRVSY